MDPYQDFISKINSFVDSVIVLPEFHKKTPAPLVYDQPCKTDADVENYFKGFRHQTADWLVEESKNVIRLHPDKNLRMMALSAACGLDVYRVELIDCDTNKKVAVLTDEDAIP